ncbi:antitoxin Xre/MbcA/ParS toxin-binding domain-containing protein [Roseateles albus]|uniref:DUF2384 domain-containing protein n=1 Tax=Roseateles albus TaxID=2987525 RepID=A0ABT5KHD5_9BURK|nr:antitoxin Xre/MbcA/ParS toxin-binding domain-containing protein [Roseateles albus]MDC8773345.1 DUF2384 domain-containing protein [Roseateles albus]
MENTKPISSTSTGDPPVASAVTGVKIFNRLADVWGLDAADRHCLLGFETPDPELGLSSEAQFRLSHLLNIFQILQTLLPDREAADSWIKLPNNAPIFGGRSALELMRSGRMEDLESLHAYLDGVM